MFERFHKGTCLPFLICGTLILASCGGSDTGSQDSTSVGSVDVVAVDESAIIESFCKDAVDESINAATLSDDAQVDEVAKQLTTRAEVLARLAEGAPASVRADVELMSDAATSMAESLTADPTLGDFKTALEKYSTTELDKASKNIDAFIATNCEG